ncbi:hypothetical protein [Deinococcus roseus]|uniref:Uncharacterized protein n=1 Tax=Deinococcus roseus TaxID=392414 RepID=A0ABQ2D3K2_9DEIO|nr:hypothetical protein [Deinococcus roseus]GGJ44779.1 hypothetical protein GCM10008938_33740 [Deinococcus roseus]
MLSEEVRDFIMVVTVEGEVATLPLHQIDRVQAHMQRHPLAVVVMKDPQRTLVIQETAERFLERCQKLHRALVERDLAGINRHLAPAV